MVRTSSAEYGGGGGLGIADGKCCCCCGTGASYSLWLFNRVGDEEAVALADALPVSSEFITDAAVELLPAAGWFAGRAGYKKIRI